MDEVVITKNSSKGRPPGSGQAHKSDQLKAMILLIREYPDRSIRSITQTIYNKMEINNHGTEVEVVQWYYSLYIRKIESFLGKDALVILSEFQLYNNTRFDMNGFMVADIYKDEQGVMWSVKHSRSPFGPILTPVKNDTKVHPDEFVDHDVFRSIKGLGEGYDWDDRRYRKICEKIGLDADRGRPSQVKTRDIALAIYHHEDRQAQKKKFPKDKISRSKPDTDAEYWDSFKDHLNKSDAARLIDNFDAVGDAYSPGRLMKTHEILESERVSPDLATQIRADIKNCFYSLDWYNIFGESAFVREIASPWGYRGDLLLSVTNVDAERLEGGLAKISAPSHPVFLEPPREGNFFERHMLLALERNGLGIVLSPDEVRDYVSCGDASYWTKKHDRDAISSISLKSWRSTSDLSMTRGLVQRYLATAYAGYVARVKNRAFDPKSALSHEIRPRVGASTYRTADARSLLGFLRTQVWEIWRCLRWWEFRNPISRGADNVVTAWGDFFVIDVHGRDGVFLAGPRRFVAALARTWKASMPVWEETGSFRAVVRRLRFKTLDVLQDAMEPRGRIESGGCLEIAVIPGREPLYIHDYLIKPNFTIRTFPTNTDWKIPDIAGKGFSMVDERTKDPVPFETMMTIVDCALSAWTLLEKRRPPRIFRFRGYNAPMAVLLFCLLVTGFGELKKSIDSQYDLLSTTRLGNFWVHKKISPTRHFEVAL